MVWTLELIKSEIREITGRRTTSQLTEARLDSFLNEFYTLYLPVELDLEELHGYATADTTASNETLTLDSNILYLSPPYTIGGYPLEITDDPVKFYDHYPKDGEPYTIGLPVMALYQGRTLTLRPAPDDVYEFHSAALVIPNALGVGQSPVMDIWGRAIVLGVSILIYGTAGQRDQSAALQSAYDYQKTLIQRPTLIKMQNYRGPGRF